MLTVVATDAVVDLDAWRMVADQHSGAYMQLECCLVALHCPEKW